MRRLALRFACSSARDATGRIVVTYASNPAVREDTLEIDVRIGRLEGDGPDTFGDVRAIEVGEDGTIYVLDYQASELRAFTPEGSYLRTIASRGRGPGEIATANGLKFAPDGTLWVNDHGKRMLTGLSVGGGEVGHHPAVVPGWGYVWTGTIDSNGVFWEQWNHSITPPQIDVSATGPVENESRGYYKSFDPRTEAYDSVELGVAKFYGYRAAYQGGQANMRIPFTSSPVVTMDRSGNIWIADSGAYTVTRMSSTGDTVLVLQVNVPTESITQEDREAWRSSSEAIFEQIPALREVEALFPQSKPLLTGLIADDEGRLWVGRTVAAGESPLFDVYDGEGEYRASVRLFEAASSNLKPVIRGDRVYALGTGEFDEHYILAGELPPSLRQR